MRGLVYAGPRHVSVATVADPVVPGEHGAVVRVAAAGICGSDLHIYHGHGFSSDTGYCLGHEAVGEVVEVGGAVTSFGPGDRVLVPGSVGCSTCAACRSGDVLRCSNLSFGETISCYGLSHALPGSQAEMVAVPHAETNLVPVPPQISDEAAVLLTDNAPTAWYGARRARIAPGDTVAVIGLGPVGLMAVQAAFVMGAARVVGVDRVPARLQRAAELGAEPIEADSAKADIRTATAGGTDVAIEAVGSDTTIALAISAVRQGGRVSVVGVSHNKAFPLHMQAMQLKELEFAIGLCSVQRELPTLVNLTAAGRLKPEAVVSHRLPLSQGVEAYRMVSERAAGVCKVILDPSR